MKNGKLNMKERDQLKRAVYLMNKCINQREKNGLDFEVDQATSSLCTAVCAIHDYFYETRGE